MVDTIKISKVLGDPIRHKILLMLVSQSKQTHSCCSVPTGGICNCQIMADFGMIRSRVSYHMKELLDAGLVGEFPKGKWRYYFLNVDVIISNCVINLSGNKDKVFHETFHVLKPGGRFAVADIVLRKKLPEKIQQDMLAWAGCVAGALLDKEYRDYLAAAGFTDIDIEIIREYVLSDEKMVNLLENLSSAETKQLNGAIVSAFVRAKKP